MANDSLESEVYGTDNVNPVVKAFSNPARYLASEAMQDLPDETEPRNGTLRLGGGRDADGSQK